MLDLLSIDTEWMENAFCQDPRNYAPGLNADIFVSSTDFLVLEAKRMCAQCSVVEECLDMAISTGQDVGVWGGTNPEERKMINRRNRKKTA